MNATLAYGISYMKVMLVGLPPFLFVQLYASTLRECGETMLPMKAGITAVFVNLIFNYNPTNNRSIPSTQAIFFTSQQLVLNR